MSKEFPSHIRKVSYEERFGNKELKETEKMGYYKHDQVVVDMGPEYQQRLAELREFSKNLNIAIQTQLDKTDLPVTTKKKHNKILRINFQVRPPFVNTEEEKENTRFNPADDEVIIFWHVNHDNKYNGIRSMSRPWNQAMLYAQSFDPEFNPNEEKTQLKSFIEKQDIENLTTYIISKLESNNFIKYFQQASNLENIEQAQKYFTDNNLYLLNDKIIQNLLKNGLLNLLKNQEPHINTQKLNNEQINQLITNILQEFMEINIPNYESDDKTAEQFLKLGLDDNKYKALINDIIKQAKDYYKTQKFKKK